MIWRDLDEGNLHNTNRLSNFLDSCAISEQGILSRMVINAPPPLVLLLVSLDLSHLKMVNPGRPSSASRMSGNKFVSNKEIASYGHVATEVEIRLILLRKPFTF